MPRPRYENVDPAKKARLISAARREFAQHGYELASINRILDEAGFSKGSFYYYFDDKADLASTLFEIELEASVDPVKRLRLPDTAEEFWAELRTMSLERLKQLEADRPRYDALLRLTNVMLKDPTFQKRVLPQLNETRRAMAGFFERGQAIGALRTDIPLGTQIALIEAAKTTAYTSMFSGETVPTDAQLESFTDLVIDLAKRISSR